VLLLRSASAVWSVGNNSIAMPLRALPCPASEEIFTELAGPGLSVFPANVAGDEERFFLCEQPGRMSAAAR